MIQEAKLDPVELVEGTALVTGSTTSTIYHPSHWSEVQDSLLRLPTFFFINFSLHELSLSVWTVWWTSLGFKMRPVVHLVCEDAQSIGRGWFMSGPHLHLDADLRSYEAAQCVDIKKTTDFILMNQCFTFSDSIFESELNFIVSYCLGLLVPISSNPMQQLEGKSIHQSINTLKDSVCDFVSVID